jgi:uncharacterized protein
MKINVDNPCKINGLEKEFDITETLSGINTIEGDFGFNKPVHVYGKVINTCGIIIVKGHIETICTMTCGKCLETKDDILKLEFKENFVAAQSKNDDEDYIFEGDDIIIDQAIIDNILLNLPMRYVCSPKCKGLCKICGADLNKGNCDCSDNVIDERLQKLGDFFKKE